MRADKAGERSREMRRSAEYNQRQQGMWRENYARGTHAEAQHDNRSANVGICADPRGQLSRGGPGQSGQPRTTQYGGQYGQCHYGGQTMATKEDAKRTSNATIYRNSNQFRAPYAPQFGKGETTQYGTVWHGPRRQ